MDMPKVMGEPSELAQSAQNNKKPVFWSESLGRYVIQPVEITTAKSFAKALYFLVLEGQVPVLAGENSIVLHAGCRLGFNSYVNSFYGAYWVENTAVREVSLSGVIRGRAVISLFRSTPVETVLVGDFPVGFENSATDFHVHFNLYDCLPTSGAGRMFFDIRAIDRIELDSLAFCTQTPPKRDVALSLGICTYKKPEYISNIVLLLERFLREQKSAITDVFVVNNDLDREGHGLDIIEDVAARQPRIRLLHQSNIGGAGGFTRTLRESIKSSASTHHVFLDDDIYLDTSVFHRLPPFLSYCVDDFIIGGHMFDMKRPQVLYEGGAKLDYWGFLQKVGDNILVEDVGELCFYNQVRDVDYNAWWFAAIPKKYASDVGLPLNIFIRGDDFEYGLRLREAGVKTVSLPGVFVWHEPFEGKNASWLEYYNWRNRLIICSIHGGEGSLDVQPADMLRDIIAEHLQGGRLEIAFVMARALLDFLMGPESVLRARADAFHEKLRSDLKEIDGDGGVRIAALLTEHPALAQLETQPTTVPGIIKSPRLGGRMRTVKEIPWLKSPMVGAMDQVIACYAVNIESVKQAWKSEYSSLTDEAAWKALYS